MGNNKTSVYRGGGINGIGVFASIDRAVQNPSKKSAPVGVTWPLARLSVNDNMIKFDMLQIHKSTKSSKVTICLNKWGYVLFRPSGVGNDGFMFATLSLDSLMRDLEERGYVLDKSCFSNRLIAKIWIFGSTVLTILFAITILTLGILFPNGM